MFITYCVFVRNSLFLLFSLSLSATDSYAIRQAIKNESYPNIDISRLGEENYINNHLRAIEESSKRKASLRKQLLESFVIEHAQKRLETDHIDEEFLTHHFPSFPDVSQEIMTSANEGLSLYYLRNALDFFVVKEVNTKPNYELLSKIDEQRALEVIADFFAKNKIKNTAALQVKPMIASIETSSDKRKFVVLEGAAGSCLSKILKSIPEDRIESSIKDLFYAIGKSRGHFDVEMTMIFEKLSLEEINIEAIRSVTHGDFHTDNVFISDDKTVSSIDNSGMVFSLDSPKNIRQIIARDFKKLCGDVVASNPDYQSFLALMQRSLLEGYSEALFLKPDEATVTELLEAYDLPDGEFTE